MCGPTPVFRPWSIKIYANTEWSYQYVVNVFYTARNMIKKLILIGMGMLALSMASQAQRVVSYATDLTRTLDLTQGTAAWGATQMGVPVIDVNPAVRHQEIDGFGAAITGSTAYNLSLMPAEARHAFLEETFSPNKVGFSYVRV